MLGSIGLYGGSHRLSLVSINDRPSSMSNSLFVVIILDKLELDSFVLLLTVAHVLVLLAFGTFTCNPVELLEYSEGICACSLNEEEEIFLGNGCTCCRPNFLVDLITNRFYLYLIHAA